MNTMERNLSKLNGMFVCVMSVQNLENVVLFLG
uniref:Uncharacterized protein n=1 Tax=Anguilla anguilla TaxID=7936 RepID=A0A0E9ST61_ANGAN